MKLSDAGLAVLKGFEGYHRKVDPSNPESDCVAYQCQVGKNADGSPVYDGKWTLGYGCTEGVTEGMRWTYAQAIDALRRELAKHEAHVTRLVTVDLTQEQFDALTLFCYNVGPGGHRDPETGKITPGLSTSTLLRKLNAGDYEGAAEQFGAWTGSNGVKRVPGLVSRRAAERALFLTPPTIEAPWMPQTVAPEPAPAKQAHHEADQQLSGESFWYAIRRLALRNAQPVTGAAMLTGGLAQLPDIRIPSFDQIERIAAFLQANGWRWSLTALVIAVALETLQAAKRAPVVNGDGA